MKIGMPINKILGAALVTAGFALNISGQTSDHRSATAMSDQYLVEFKGTGVPNDLSARVAKLGGKVIDLIPEMKVALVADLTESKALALAAEPDVADVTLDEFLPRPEPVRRIGRYTQPVSEKTSTADPTTAIVYPYQWNMRVIEANRETE